MVVLVAIDENERSQRIVTTGADLAEKYDTKLVVLHVVPEEDYEAHRESLSNIPGFDNFSVTQEQESAKAFASKFVDEIVGDTGSVDIEFRGRVGNVADMVIEEVDTVQPQFLVISGRRRSPVGKALFGNTAQQILLNADCPVVTIMADT